MDDRGPTNKDTVYCKIKDVVYGDTDFKYKLYGDSVASDVFFMAVLRAHSKYKLDTVSFATRYTGILWAFEHVLLGFVKGHCGFADIRVVYEDIWHRRTLQDGINKYSTGTL